MGEVVPNGVVTSVGLAVAALGLAACGTGIDYSQGEPAPESSASGDASAPAFDFQPVVSGQRACVVLPSAAAEGRWETVDRPILEAAFEAAGVESDIRASEGDPAGFVTVVQDMLAQGCAVLLIVSPDAESGAAAIAEADINGVTTIDYHHLTAGGGAGYYVGYDDMAVGEALGVGLAQCLATANVGGDEVALVGDAGTVGESAPLLAAFTEAVTKAGLTLLPAVDVADGTSAEGAVSELVASGVAGIGVALDGAGNTVEPVTDQISGSPSLASVSSGLDGVQRILLGEECLTIYKSARKEATAAAELAVAIAHSDFVTADAMATAITVDPATTAEVPTVPLEALTLRRDGIASLVDDGELPSEDLCGSAALAAACADVGIS